MCYSEAYWLQETYTLTPTQTSLVFISWHPSCSAASLFPFLCTLVRSSPLFYAAVSVLFRRVMCCSVGFARSLGLALLPLALCSILANLLLLFPMGEISYIQENRLSSYIWYSGGLGGGGLLVRKENLITLDYFPQIIILLTDEYTVIVNQWILKLFPCCGCPFTSFIYFLHNLWCI